jgi:hypothetical protein
MRKLAAATATALALLPAAGYAHGDHSGVRGAFHLLLEPDHLGGAVLGLLTAGLLARGVYGMRRRSKGDSRETK